MNKVDQRAFGFSSTNTGVDEYEILKGSPEKASELLQISSELEMELSINSSLVNELMNSAERLSSIKSMTMTGANPIVEESRPLSLVETLSKKVIELRNNNNRLSVISLHFNKVI